jgi:uncharacterized protein YndB with AHSA1/START domain
MPVTDITKDIENRTLVITAEFAAPVERVWGLYEDARQLEQVWGPPEYPATFVDHELRPGTRSTYYMTSPEGQKFAGYWDITTVEALQRLAFLDGFAHEDLTPNPELPVGENVYVLEPVDGGTRATYTSTFATADDLQKVLDMGIEEGATSAINQIDGFLADNTQNA